MQSSGSPQKKAVGQYSTRPKEDKIWPTMDASVSNAHEDPETWLARKEKMKAKGYNSNGCGTPLGMAVKVWPTPTKWFQNENLETWRARKEKMKAKGYNSNGCGTPLNMAVKLQATPATFPSPCSSDHKGSAKPGQRRGQLSEIVVGSILNATWVEKLMGFPPGWSSL